jgi:two-component system, chemotaxis family, response regulator Rcp1
VYEEKNLVEVLLVEDNPGDARLCVEAFKESKILNQLNIVEDGREALDYVFKLGKYSDVNTPDLIILDLNLPKIDGKEVLRQIRENEDTTDIPIIILTSSKSEEDIVKTYQLHANSYVTKPLDFEQFIGVVQKLNNFWLEVVKFPRR